MTRTFERSSDNSKVCKHCGQSRHDHEKVKRHGRRGRWRHEYECPSTVWADCGVCGLTTNPDVELPGNRDPSDVVVRGELGNGELDTGSVSRKARRRGLTSGCSGEVVLP